jgi:hypothetical protein
MDSNGVVNVAPVLPIPDFQLVKLVRSSDEQAERPPHIFNRFIPVDEFFKAQFSQLLVIQGDHEQISWFKPVVLVPIVYTNLSVFMVQFGYNPVKSLTSEICLNDVSNSEILKSDHMTGFFEGMNIKKFMRN